MISHISTKRYMEFCEIILFRFRQAFKKSLKHSKMLCRREGCSVDFSDGIPDNQIRLENNVLRIGSLALDEIDQRFGREPSFIGGILVDGC